MASKLSPATPRPRVQREASGLAGERIASPSSKIGSSGVVGERNGKATPPDRRSPRLFSAEKRTPIGRGAELHHVQEELLKTKEQLALLEKSKSNVLQDLARSKGQVEDLTAKLQVFNEAFSMTKDCQHAEEREFSSLEVMKRQYEKVMQDLQEKKQAMESLKHELIVCVEAKDEAVRLAGEALNAAESTQIRLEELSAELIATRGSLAGATSSEMDDLMADLECDGDDNPTFIARSDSDPKLEVKLKDRNDMTEGLQLELASVKSEASSKLHKGVLEASIARSETEVSKQDLAFAQVFESQLKDAWLALQEMKVELYSGKGSSSMNSETQNAVHEPKNLRSELEILKHELISARNCEIQLRKAKYQVEKLQFELSVLKEAESGSEYMLINLNSILEQLRSDLADSNEVDRMSKSIVSRLSGADDTEQGEYSSATHEAVDADGEKDKGTKESTALPSAQAVLTSQLEEAEERLVKMMVEGAVFVSFLKSFQSTLERNQTHIKIMEENEVYLKMKMEDLNRALSKMTEDKQREVGSLEDQIASATIAMASVEEDCKRQKMELVILAEKESAASLNATNLVTKLEHVQMELKNVGRKESLSSEKHNLLERELEASHRELTIAKEKELDLFLRVDVLSTELETSRREALTLKDTEMEMNSKIAMLNRELESCRKELSVVNEREAMTTLRVEALVNELEVSQKDLSAAKKKQLKTDSEFAALFERKELEALELKKKADYSDARADALLLDLERAQCELEERKERECSVSAKASEALELAEREKAAKTELVEPNVHREKVNFELEEAIDAAKTAREDADRLQVSLELAIAEKDHARQQEQEAKAEAIRNNEKAVTAAIEAETARFEARKAMEETRQGAEELQSLKESLKIMEGEMDFLRRETKTIKDELKTVKLENILGEELEKERKTAQASREYVEALKVKVINEKEQAKVAADETRAALSDVEKAREEVEKKKTEEKMAIFAHKTIEDKLHSAPIELNRVKHDAATQDEGEHKLADLTSGELDESDDAEGLIAIVESDSEALTASTVKSQRELESVKLEKEASERALMELQQLLAETEKAKANMEAEIQRLRDDSKQWHMTKDALDIPVHNDVIVRANIIECRDEKPQLDPIENEVVDVNISLSNNGGAQEHNEHMNNEELNSVEELDSTKNEVLSSNREELACSTLKKDEVVAEKDQDGHGRDEVVSQEEISDPSLPTKKKKKTLLVRLGTLLEKKKHAQAP